MAPKPRAQFSAAETGEIIRLMGSDDDLVLVGGQALNYWAERFRPTDPALDRFRPFTSGDVDFLGRAHSIQACAAAFHGKVFVPSADHNTPEIAVVEGTHNGKKLRIDFLGSLAGLSTSEVQERATLVTDDETGIRFRVMHPVMVLESRLANVSGVLARRDEQSIRQLGAAVRIVGDYIAVAIKEGVRPALNLIERVFRIAQQPHASKVFFAFGIDLFDAIENSPELPAAFRTRRYPQMAAELRAERDAYAATLLRAGKGKAGPKP